MKGEYDFMQQVMGSFTTRRNPRPCPFCKSQGPLRLHQVLNAFTEASIGWFVECRLCGVSGGEGDTKAMAYIKWDRKADRILGSMLKQGFDCKDDMILGGHKKTNRK